MDLADDLRARNGKQVIVAAQVAMEVLETLPAILGLGEPMALDHRAHGAVEHEDALLERVMQGGDTGGAGGDRLIHMSPRRRPGPNLQKTKNPSA